MLDPQRLQVFMTKREDDWQRFQKGLAEDDKRWKEEQERKAEERHREQMDALMGAPRQTRKSRRKAGDRHGYER